jgi:uncharacterized protein (TIGR02996 family)
VTSEADFQAALTEDPNDWQTRLVFADWLDERGDERADGYRAMGMLRLRPHAMGTRNWWTAEGDGNPYYNHLPRDWFAAVAGYEHQPDQWRWPTEWDHARDNRAEIEDAAARAFQALPAQRRALYLAGSRGHDYNPGE